MVECYFETLETSGIDGWIIIVFEMSWLAAGYLIIYYN
jgi:hypothetical protein